MSVTLGGNMKRAALLCLRQKKTRSKAGLALLGDRDQLKPQRV